MNRDATFHMAAEREMLRQCAASGQIGASQLHQHQVAGELPGQALEQLGQELRLALEIADDACRVDIECRALSVVSDHPGPVYDVSALEPDHICEPELTDSYRQGVERAVRYLDLRGQLVRPHAGQPHLVSFHRA